MAFPFFNSAQEIQENHYTRNIADDIYYGDIIGVKTILTGEFDNPVDKEYWPEEYKIPISEDEVAHYIKETYNWVLDPKSFEFRQP